MILMSSQGYLFIFLFCFVLLVISILLGYKSDKGTTYDGFISFIELRIDVFHTQIRSFFFAFFFLHYLLLLVDII